MSRKISYVHDLKHLPVGAVVANGCRIGEEWLFRKNLAGRWEMYDPETHDTSGHKESCENRGWDWAGKLGFSSLNLPVYLLSKTGEADEVDHFLPLWREHKLDWLAH